MTGPDRTPKPCHHQQVKHQHGTRLAYVLDKCRCLPCAAANSAYENRRHRLKGYGRPTTTWVDAGPARAHVQTLQAAGLGWKRIADVAGVDWSLVSRLLYGRKRGGRQEAPARRINPQAAAALLAVPMPTALELPGGARVDGIGTARRVQALACLGWSVARIATEANVDRQALDRALRGGGVAVSTARAIAAAYDRLWAQQPTAADRFERAGISRALNQAKGNGWLPPLAWDDGDIDDPDAVPQPELGPVDGHDEHAVELVLDGQPMRLTGRDLEVAVERLAAAGCDATTIAGRVRSDEPTVRRIRNTVQVRAARAAAREAAA